MNTFSQAYHWYSQLVRSTSRDLLGVTIDPLMLAGSLFALVVIVVIARSITSHK